MPRARRLTVPNEQAAALEYQIIHGEIFARTEFNRRVQQLQFGLIGAGVAAAAALKLEAITWDLTLIAASVLAALTIALFMEANQNNTYIAFGASYIDRVFNRRYQTEDGGRIIRYVEFLGLKRDRSRNPILRFAFYLDAQVLINAVLFALAGGLYIFGIHHSPSGAGLGRMIASLWMVVMAFLFIVCMWRHFLEPRLAGSDLTLEEADTLGLPRQS